MSENWCFQIIWPTETEVWWDKHTSRNSSAVAFMLCELQAGCSEAFLKECEQSVEKGPGGKRAFFGRRVPTAPLVVAGDLCCLLLPKMRSIFKKAGIFHHSPVLLNVFPISKASGFCGPSCWDISVFFRSLHQESGRLGHQVAGHGRGGAPEVLIWWRTKSQHSTLDPDLYRNLDPMSTVKRSSMQTSIPIEQYSSWEQLPTLGGAVSRYLPLWQGGKDVVPLVRQWGVFRFTNHKWQPWDLNPHLG